MPDAFSDSMEPQDSNTRLQEFVDASKAKGAADEFLATFLIRRGWPAEDVYRALGKYWESATGLAVPERSGAGESARDAFLYLLSFSTLGTWATALGSLIFEFIHHWVPDPVAVNSYTRPADVTWQMASVAVAFPIYLLVTRLIFREASSHPERLQSGVRKWLTYIALLITAVTMVCDLIWFLNYFLNGGLTARFMLKSAAVMAISGSIFAFYLSFLRWNRATDAARERRRGVAFAIAASLAAVVAFCVGLGIAGTPAVQRLASADRQRVDDLRTIARSINLWRIRAKSSGSSPEVPGNLTELGTGPGIVPRITDPMSNVPYGYRQLGGTRFELCGQFVTDNRKQSNRYPDAGEFWAHGKGRACFALDAAQAAPW